MSNINELKKSWCCPSCDNVTRRRKNDNTPIRKQCTQPINDTTLSANDLTDDQNLTKHGDCGPTENKTHRNTPQSAISKDITITLEHISLLLDRKLEETKKSILNAIQNTKQTEVQKAMHELKSDLTNTTNTLLHEQTALKNHITLMDKTIEKLETDNKGLREDIILLQNNSLGTQQQNTDITKKIVLYGLLEHEHETEHHLYQRIVHIFQDILNVDLTGYIEELTRIGRNNSRRPIVIELLSKKMTKYLLQNAQFFRNTGLSISEYLNEKALQNRKHLQEQVRNARLHGHHAVIRNNKLYVLVVFYV